MAMFSRLALLQTKFGMTAARPVKEQNDLSVVFIDVGDDLI